ncbi:hypothetical protein DPMN_043380 [Dreissena polymorpha]|uniref:Uncharacterized protein n=1 Tax=Dreissena polymorpha TaxID=45954 RepID=A0A9D4HXW7_DREPO|nr:hypothetical protein DPMN_043380 [Dreissena polymorpha]
MKLKIRYLANKFESAPRINISTDTRSGCEHKVFAIKRLLIVSCKAWCQRRECVRRGTFSGEFRRRKRSRTQHADFRSCFDTFKRHRNS